MLPSRQSRRQNDAQGPSLSGIAYPIEAAVSNASKTKQISCHVICLAGRTPTVASVAPIWTNFFILYRREYGFLL